MSLLDVAQARKGNLRDGYSAVKAGASDASTAVEYGFAVADSVGGMVEIRIDNSTDTFEVPCDSPIAAGDRVSYISTKGKGKAVSVATLYQIAQDAEDIASATNQYFWNDTNGIHVSTDAEDPAGAQNILVNAVGILLRKAANFLMSISENAISFFDGSGNDAENIVAMFGRDGAVIGSNSSSQVIVTNDGLDITDDNHIVIASMKDSQTVIVDNVKKSVQFNYDVSKSTTTLDGISAGTAFSVGCSYTYVRNGSTYTSVTSTETFTQGTASTKDLVGNPFGIGDIPIVSVKYELPNKLTFVPRLNMYSTSYNITVEYSNGSFSAPIYSFGTRTNGDGGFSVILGRELEADTDYSVATGKFNDDGNYALMIGNGTADNARSNALTVDWSGNVVAAGDITDGNGTAISDLSVDYIVESGDSGIWYYRKWNGGKAECWCKASKTITGWSSWGSLYESTPAIQVSYPSGLFLNPPRLFASPNNGGAGLCGIEMYNAGTASQTPEMYLLRPTTGSTGTTFYIDLYAMGAWR